MRPLLPNQVKSCELGRNKRCRCRCGGLLHGAQRARLIEYFEKLPEADPHHIPERSRQLPLPPPIGVPR